MSTLDCYKRFNMAGSRTSLILSSSPFKMFSKQLWNFYVVIVRYTSTVGIYTLLITYIEFGNGRFSFERCAWCMLVSTQYYLYSTMFLAASINSWFQFALCFFYVEIEIFFFKWIIVFHSSCFSMPAETHRNSKDRYIKFNRVLIFRHPLFSKKGIMRRYDTVGL